MKRFIPLTILTALITLQNCGYRRIGDLTVVSNRNINLQKEYVLIKRDVSEKCKLRKQDALEIAIDKVVEKYEGEYMENLKIYIQKNGGHVKITGDIWGFKK